MNTIAFIGHEESFAFNGIGGVDSYIRRLTFGLLDNASKYKVHWVFYKCKIVNEIKHKKNFSSYYFQSFDSLLTHIKNKQYNHVVVTSIHPIDRLRLFKFRFKNPNIKFHKILFFYPKSILKRTIKFLEFIITPYNGKLFCVSKRQYRFFRFSKKSLLLLPPIPEEYYLNKKVKNYKNQLNISFVGRIDPRKGIKDVIELFHVLNTNKYFTTTLFGIHIKKDKDGYNLHKKLKEDSLINYIPVNRKKYSEAIEDKLKKLFEMSDICIMPYQSLDSTVDTPLLVLEALASLCIVISTNIGDVPDLVGNKRNILPRKEFHSHALDYLNKLNQQEIINERKRVYQHIRELRTSTKEIVNIFKNAIDQKQ